MKIFNTLSGQKEEFVPQSPPAVSMYVCGVTPYSSAHLGHAMSYINFDVIRRYLEFRGYRVKHVQNFTDIDDKIIERAARLAVPPSALAEQHIQEFFREMDSLNVQRATVYPRATQELPKIIELIDGLIARGYAYPAQGDVYFRVRRDEDYGQLSHRVLEGMMAGARVQPGAQKEHPMDFALWKAAKEGEPEWPSPWGPGRPGWHIECSAMALHHLGETIDFHGGGRDLIFPHHENEIAQSESFTGKHPFVRYWLHNGLMEMGEEKMSKSLGNMVTIQDALEKYSADAVRLFILGSHYRNPLSFSEDSLAGAFRAAERLRNALGSSPKEGGRTLEAEPYRERFIQAMDDDFNAPQALAALFDLARDTNRAADEGMDVSPGKTALRELAGVLGLKLDAPKAGAGIDAAPFIDLLVTTRNELRQAKQYTLADSLRQRLATLGVTLEDTAQGTAWKSGR
ncbi:MAG: cysS [Dehalococcoidia bacterium]|nr:cysS [Dehalococcoidia bacterium]